MKLVDLFEIELGGDLTSASFDDERSEDYKNPQLDLFHEIPTIEPNIPKGYKLVGKMNEIVILQRSGTYDDYNKFGNIIDQLPDYTYVLVKFGKPVAYFYTVEKTNHLYMDLKGKGLMTKNVFVEPEARGNNIALNFYNWLLHHVCDYIIPDEMHTHAGAALWRKLNNSRKFEVLVYNPNTSSFRKLWAGKDWNRIYKNDDLQPVLTLPGRYIESDEYESAIET